MNAFKVLGVDDESRMRKLLKDFLTMNGYEILEAENGQKALELFKIPLDVLTNSPWRVYKVSLLIFIIRQGELIRFLSSENNSS